MKQQTKPASLRKKRIARFVACGILLPALLALGINYFIIGSTTERIITVDEAAALNADAILVLGARVWDNGLPSGILRIESIQESQSMAKAPLLVCS